MYKLVISGTCVEIIVQTDGLHILNRLAKFVESQEETVWGLLDGTFDGEIEITQKVVSAKTPEKEPAKKRGRPVGSKSKAIKAK